MPVNLPALKTSPRASGATLSANGAAAGAAFGAWKSARITDAGRPLGRVCRVGERAYYREGEEIRGVAARHLLLERPGGAGPGNGGIRRWIDEVQLDGATDRHAADVTDAQQGGLSALWARLDPVPAGFHPGTRIPRRYKGLDVLLTDRNPDVEGPGWQGDTVAAALAPPDMVLILERRVVVTPPKMPPPERLAAIVAEFLEHEWRELLTKGELVDERWPHISDRDRARCLDEMEGIAHILTIGTVDGFYGPDAQRRYLDEVDYAQMRELGFGKLVDRWQETDL